MKELNRIQSLYLQCRPSKPLPYDIWQLENISPKVKRTTRIDRHWMFQYYLKQMFFSDLQEDPSGPQTICFQQSMLHWVRRVRSVSQEEVSY